MLNFSVEVLKTVTDCVTISYIINRPRVIMSSCCFSFEPVMFAAHQTTRRSWVKIQVQVKYCEGASLF